MHFTLVELKRFSFGEWQVGTVHLCRSVSQSKETVPVFKFEEFPTNDQVRYLTCLPPSCRLSEVDLQIKAECSCRVHGVICLISSWMTLVRL